MQSANSCQPNGDSGENCFEIWLGTQPLHSKSTSNRRNNILKEDNEIRPKADNDVGSQICNFNEHMIQARSRRVAEGQGSNIGKRERNETLSQKR